MYALRRLHYFLPCKFYQIQIFRIETEYRPQSVSIYYDINSCSIYDTGKDVKLRYDYF